MIRGCCLPPQDRADLIALTRDGAAAHRLERRHAFIADNLLNNVSLIGTTTNPPSVTATATVGSSPVGVAITPDGNYAAYVVNSNMFVPGTVSVIDTSTNKAMATVLVGQGTFGMGVMPPPSVPFLAFVATLAVDVGGPPPEDTFNVHSSFTLSSTASNGINPVAEPVTLQVGTYTTIIPASSFTKHKNGSFGSAGVIGGVSLDALIKPTGTLRYEFNAKGQGTSLTGTTNPVAVALTIGDDSSATSVTAHIAR